MRRKIMVKKNHSLYAVRTFFLALFLLWPATTFAMDLNQLANNADVILFGRAVKVECRWAKSSMNILSRTQFQVKICIKGRYAAGDRIEIETYGGVIQGMKQKVPNCAAFHSGEYALVFLRGGQGDLYYVTDGKEGKIPFPEGKGMRSVTGGKKLDRTIRKIRLALRQ